MSDSVEQAGALFAGPGEMRHRCRTYPWDDTPLGPVEGWSPALRILVQSTLASGLPQIVLWGRELIQIYNDAYAELIRAKHPRALGRGNIETWPEVADVNTPIYERVFAGEGVTFQDALYPLERSGRTEEVFLTISYSPIRELDGDVAGVLVTMVETTQNVAIRRLEAERERLLLDLEAERSRLTTVFEQAPALIATVRGPRHVFEMANPSYLRLIGDRDVIGRPIAEALPEIAEQGFVDLLDEVFRTGQPYTGTEVPIQIQRGEGEMEERFFNFIYQPLRDGSGSVTGILAHGYDVTELVAARHRQEEQADELRVQAQQLGEIQVELEEANQELVDTNAALQDERVRLAAVVEHAPVGILMAEAPSGRILAGNRRIEEILRHPLLATENLSEYGQWIAFHPGGRQVEGEEYPLARVITTGKPSGPVEFLYQRGDGTLGWVQITGVPIHDTQGRLTSALVVVDDIDEQRRAEEEREGLLASIEQERSLLRELFERAPAVMALYSGPDHVVELVNPTWERTVGKPDAVGRPLREVFPEASASGVFEILDRIYRSGEPYLDPRLYAPIIRWEGGEPDDTWWNLAFLPLPSRPDGTRDILVHAVEVTGQVRTDQQVRALTRASLAVHSAPSLEASIQVITDEARRIVGAHQSITSMTSDQQGAQLIYAVSLSDRYEGWRDYSVPPDGSGIYAMVCETNRPVRMTQEELEQHPRWRAFGEHAREHPPMRGWLAVPLIGRDGRNLGLIQLSDRYAGEFTEDDEAVLVQLAQMASIAIENGRLYEEAVEANRVKAGFLATMSHELRTPLNAMIGYAELLEMGVPEPINEGALMQVERIRLSAHHLLQLIEEILTFSRVEAGRERVEVEIVAVAELVREVSAIIEPLALRKDLNFRVQDEASEVVLRTDPRKVRQVLLNLLGNAVKFTEAEAGEVGFRVARSGDELLVEVTDTGIGIAPENLERIFEPFWQAETEIHARVSGTGLGLPVTRQLVGLLGGTLSVESSHGVGSAFHLRLPLEYEPKSPSVAGVAPG